jgi:starch-binding outer membrane protein, SusD/RagB family
MQSYKKVFIIATLVASTMSLSCSKELETTPINIVDVANFYQNGNDAEVGLAGCYNRVFGGCLLDFHHWGSLASDDGRPWADAGTAVQFDRRDGNLTLVQGGNITDGTWRTAYSAIANLNLLLEKLPLIPDNKFSPATRKNEILGEAYFLRGYVYLNLLQFWGGVPLVSKFPSSTNQSANAVPRSSEAETIKFIEDDFKQAENLLPFTHPRTGATANVQLANNKGRATRLAAKLLLSRVYLWQKNFQLARTKADEVITQASSQSLSYMTGTLQTNNWLSIFFGAQNTTESILETQSTTTEINLNGTNFFRYLDGFPCRAGASLNLFNAYDTAGANDIRRIATLSRVVNAPATPLNPTCIYWFKYRKNGSDADPDNFIICRLAEARMTRAECDLELNGPTQAIVDEINFFRNRAVGQYPSGTATALATTPFNMPTMASRNYTKAQMIDSLRQERRREFAFENMRWFDLRRYGNDALTAAVSASTGVTMDGQKVLFAIPLNDVVVGGVTQNPGY